MADAGEVVKQPLLILDCNFLCHQARHVMGNLSSEDVATGVTFGFLSRLLHLGELFGSSRVAFCWDSNTSYRKLAFPEYKSHRKHRSGETPEQLEELRVALEQFVTLRTTILPEMGWKNIYMLEGLEGDDLMAQLAAQRVDDEDHIWLITADADLYQCVRNKISFYSPATQKRTTAQDFFTSYHIPPSWWYRVKILSGCRGDGVPPVARGIGESTAIKYLTGQLKPMSTAFKKIHSPAALENRERNQALVVLPHEMTPRLLWREYSALSFQPLESLAEDYGMESFLSDEMRIRWEAFLNGAPLAAARSETKRGKRPRITIHDPTERRLI